MKCLNLPFLDELDAAQNILLAGAGGGYDIFTGLPLYFALKATGKNVYLSNVSSSYLPAEHIQQLTPALLKVTTEISDFIHSYPDYYFPEFYLSEWFQNQLGEDVPIYCFRKTGVKPLLHSYQTLIEN